MPQLSESQASLCMASHSAASLVLVLVKDKPGGRKRLVLGVFPSAAAALLHTVLSPICCDLLLPAAQARKGFSLFLQAAGVFLAQLPVRQLTA